MSTTPFVTSSNPLASRSALRDPNPIPERAVKPRLAAVFKLIISDS